MINGFKKKVLLIDDSEMLAELLKIFFTDNNFIFDYANNGTMGLSKVKKFNPELILCDVNMPYKDGMQFLKEKKADSSIMNIPVIMLTVDDEKKDIRMAKSLGAFDYIIKPFNLEELVDRVSDALKLEKKVKKAENTGAKDNSRVYFDAGVIFVDIDKSFQSLQIENIKYKVIELVKLYQVRRPKILFMLNDIDDDNVDETKVRQVMDIIFNNDVKAHEEDVVFLTNSTVFKSMLKVHYSGNNIIITENYKIAARKLGYKIENYKEIDINFIAENATFAYDLFDQNENIVARAGKPIIKSILDSLKARGARKLLYKISEDKKEDNEKYEPVEDEFLTLDKKHAQIKTTANPFEGKKILIAEDTQLMRVSISKYLSQQGFIPDDAGDGKEAKEKVDNNTYDLILLDLHMPQMNGLELLAHMRKNNNNTPVVVLSGVTKINVVKAAKQLNISGFLSKPLKLTTLLKKIVEVLFPSIKV